MADEAHPAGAKVPAENSASKVLANKIAVARNVIFWERLWVSLVPPAAIVALFLAVSWFGFWQNAPRSLRIVGVLLFLAALLFSLKTIFRLRPVAPDVARTRLDRESGISHRPVETLTDQLASSGSPEAQALWALHQKRTLAAVENLKVPVPDPAMRRVDFRALRFAPVLLAFAGLFVAGPEMGGRVGSAFDWFEPAVPPPPPRLDVWLDPPAYTGRPPQFLARSQSPDTALSSNGIKVPIGSVLVIRATPLDSVSVSVSGALKPVEAVETASGQTVPARPVTPAAGTFEKRFTLAGDGEATVQRGKEVLGQYKLSAIPDTAPTISLIDVKPTETRDGLLISYGIKDDYGVKEAEARFSVIVKAGEMPRRTLIPAPSAALTLPYGANAETETQSTVTLAEHPWAGARVHLQLHAVDDIGQRATSDMREVTIPQRLFTHPLAKALVEQRRALILDPDRKDRVQIALDALLIEPERFMPKLTGAYIGLRLASRRLKFARTDEKLLEVADWLWSMALEIDGDGLSDAEKALREAQERLNEALERNADAGEIKRLTEELRRAMDRFMREFAERAQREGRTAEQQPNRDNMRMLNRNDMQKMLEEIEKLSREGRHAEAQELLRQLNEAMKNLQAQRGQPGQMGERQRGMNEAMNELDQMTREQQELRDRTFRDGQDRRRRDQRSERNRQPGQQGQPGPRGQRGQPQQPGGQEPGGQQPGDGDGEQESAENGQGQGQSQGQGGSLQQRQERLRQQLERLQRRMRDLGMSGEKGLGEAEQSMRDAEGQLGQGREGSAVESQGRALEGLRRGMQGMAQQMQQQGGDGTEQADGGPGGDDPDRPGQPRANGNNSNDDPLGRNTRSRTLGENSRMRMQGHQGGTVGDRARQVLEELRRKLGEQERPRLELDYLERLLPQN